MIFICYFIEFSNMYIVYQDSYMRLLENLASIDGALACLRYKIPVVNIDYLLYLFILLSYSYHIIADTIDAHYIISLYAYIFVIGSIISNTIINRIQNNAYTKNPALPQLILTFCICILILFLTSFFPFSCSNFHKVCVTY